MKKEEFLKIPVLDQLKHIIEESLKAHKRFTSQYWEGSAFMGRNILEAIEKIRQANK